MIDSDSIEYIEELVRVAFPSHNTVCHFYKDDNYVQVMVNGKLVLLAQEKTVERLKWEMKRLTEQAKKYSWDTLLRANTGAEYGDTT